MTISLAADARADVGLFGTGRGLVALLDFVGDLVGAAVFRAAEGADGAGDAEISGVPAMTRAVKVEALNSCSA